MQTHRYDKQADTQMDGHTGGLTACDRKTNYDKQAVDRLTGRQIDMQVTAACHRAEVMLDSLNTQHYGVANFT